MTTPDEPRPDQPRPDGALPDASDTAEGQQPGPVQSGPVPPAPEQPRPVPHFTALGGAYSWPPRPVASTPPAGVPVTDAPDPRAGQPEAGAPEAGQPTPEPSVAAAVPSESQPAPESATESESEVEPEPEPEPVAPVVPVPVVAPGLPGVPAMAAAPLAGAAVSDPAVSDPAVSDPAVSDPAVSDPAVSDEPDDGPGDADDPASATDEAPAPGRRLPVAAAAAIGVLLVLLTALVAFLGLSVVNAARTETARTEAVAASRDAARALFSYDHTTLEDDFARGLAVTTGEFRQEYQRTTTEVVADVAREYDAVVLADVVESAVVTASPDEVTTIVFLNQATTSTRVQGQQVDQSRVQMRLVEVDGRWLVAEVTAL